ncbi:PREDICTED: glutactin-like [Acromyrmex echinatior]|uniref:glutactin-like n=1 Tax=Acromyrmex echinatior TaxID=103372 RepID=UPI000580DC59|nr:PREDICTED: glutactin-like [Acromyrmex echinatior]
MLIVNVILFTSAICSTTKIVTSTGASVTSATSTKSKRIDPTHNIPNNQEQSRGTQTTPRIPSPQDINLRLSPHYGNVKASVIQRVPYTGTNHGPGSHAYGSVPKQPLSYVAPSIHQTESHRSNLLTPYFSMLNNPDVYKATRSIEEKPLDASKSIVSQSHQKLQGIYSPSYNAFYQEKPIELSSFSDFEYSPLANIGKLIPQGVSSPTVQAPVYKMNYPLPKITDYAHVYAPSIPTASSITPSSDKITQSPRQKDEATVDMNGKKISLPIIRLQSNVDLSEVLPTFESQPFLLSSNYPIESDVGFAAGPKLNLALQSSNISPFSSPLSSFQGQVVPIQTTNGSPQFPQYKGASIEAYPIMNNVPKVQGNYESLYNQPQLHFDKEHNDNVQTVKVRQNTAHPPVGTQGILNDAEIINTKNPEPHTPQPDDDDDETRDDERYQNSDKEYDGSSEEDDVERQHFKASPTESDFKPSTSYPFKEYDKKFGKHRTYSDDDDFEDKPFSSYKNYSSDDDEEKEEEEEDSPSEYRSEYTEKPSHDSFEEKDEEEEEEEESRKQEKRKETNEDSSEVQPPRRSKYYQKDFEQEFEESYKEELPKEEYVHVKEVPEIDSYIDSSSSKRQQRNKSRVKQEQSKESKSQESRNSRKNRKVPKTDYRDSTAYGSDISTKTSPKVIYEEVFGYKQPKIEKYSKHAKTEKFSFTKKSPKKNDYLHAAKYYKFKNPKTESEHSSEDKDPYTNSSVNDRKLKKNSSKKTVPRSNVKQLSDSGDGVSFYEPSILSSRVRSPTNAEIFRDLTGI